MFRGTRGRDGALLAVCVVCVSVVDARAQGPRATEAGIGQADARTRDLGTITVIGRRPTSLPTQIPTTIEGITAADIEVTVNATDAEDALKYFPSLLVRKRYVGDYDHAVLATRASGTGNSARSLVYADGILLSNLLGNGATYTPRWGLVTPEEIERVDVLYGPFSAAYPGNSVGAVVDYVTRMPEAFEMRANVATFSEDFAIYGSEGDFGGGQLSASAGSRHGNFSWWLNANRLVSAGVGGAAGAAVTGVLADLNPRNQPWLILGSTSNSNTVQDHAKVKVAYDFSDTLRLSYTLGVWENDAFRWSETYLRDIAGEPVWSGPIVHDGRGYTLSAADFAPSAGDLRHLMHGFSLRRAGAGAWAYDIAASRYDYDRDFVRSPTVAMPSALVGGSGRATDQSGTGWGSIAARATWRGGEERGGGSEHVVDIGIQHDDYALRTLVSNAADWLRGAPTTRFSAFRGDAMLTSVYVQDTWAFADSWRATLGLRAERWRAEDGALSDATSTLGFADRSDTFVSPKAAVARRLTRLWSLKASVGRAVRMPTVAELYQGTIATNAIVNNDPSLKPERSWTSELSAEREREAQSLRVTAFFERTEDALYSQTNVTVTPSVTNIQNVDRIFTKGLEVAYRRSGLLDERLELSASLTFARSLIEANANFPASVGKRQPRVPEWRANVLASYRFRDSWALSLGGRYSGKQFNTLDNADPNGYTWTGTSPFVVFDARARYQGDKLTASVGVDNLGNEEYWAFHPYTRRMLMGEIGVRF
jgi:iron complex outermembrane receptor protein